MSYSEAASYFMTLIAIALAPGPVALMLVVRSASRDISGAIGFGFGYALGGLVIISVVCFGLGSWLTAVPTIFEHSKYLMMAYILWLAFGIWKGNYNLAKECTNDRNSNLSSVIAGVMTCFISPYMMILFPLVLPGIINITSFELPQFLIIALVTFMALIAGSALIIAFASQIGRLAQSPISMKILNRTLAGILTVGGGWMAFA